MSDTDFLFGLCVALGIGLLVGVERERRKGRGPTRAPAGLRTFALAGVLGSVSAQLGGAQVTMALLLAVGLVTAAAYHRSRRPDPGMTTELALLLVCLLGALAMTKPLAAAIAGIVLAVLLAARDVMHRFVRSVLSEHELHEALLIAFLALVLLPLAPDRYLGPFDAFNPQLMARLVVFMVAVHALGFVAVRSFGPRRGLALAGLGAGFVSSIAVVFAMGKRASAQGSLTLLAAGSAMLSCVATFVQVALIASVAYPPMLAALAPAVLAGGVVAALCGWACFRLDARAPGGADLAGMGNGYGLTSAFGFVALLCLALLLSGGLHQWLGGRGLLWAAAVSGLADAHASAASMASLGLKGQIPPAQTVLPVLAGLSTNALVKAVAAFRSGGKAYGLWVAAGLGLMLAAAWLAGGVSLFMKFDMAQS